MQKKVLIVEDNFIEANHLQQILENANYRVSGIARSVSIALDIINDKQPEIVLIDIHLKGQRTGIDLAKILYEKNIAFVYLSANSNKEILEEAKKTEPYGFLVKPFREKDLLVTLDIAQYLHEQKQNIKQLENGTTSPASQNLNFTGIIGNSIAIRAVLNLIKIVTQREVSVLILGESGTGKERIVDCIQQNSPRKAKPFVKVNCAALPATLMESELFGHERGAFTGAMEKKQGLFEQAQGGTIFLDEVGEMPIDLQVKLLRVLQEKEIQRIGGREVIKLNVRIITATNRNLEKEVAEGRFRMDLYYRLNVFPITVPPLRDRKEDIPLLTNYFVERYSGINEIKIKHFSAKAMEKLLKHDWPGNVRELEYVIQRSVLLSENGAIQDVPVPEIYYIGNSPLDNKITTLEQNEAAHIIKAIKLCNGKLSGPGGAAEMLNLPYSTLTSKIKKLGIKKEYL